MKIIIYTSYPYCVSAFCIKNIKILPSLFDRIPQEKNEFEKMVVDIIISQ